MKRKFLQVLLLLTAIVLSHTADAANINVTTDIVVNTTWSSNNTYILYGDIIVKNGATLTIEPGTLIKGDKTTLSRLVISTTGKINAQGTAEKPIIFTSNQSAGSRARADWAGITICGLAPVNFKDANNNPIQGRVECGTTTDYDYGGSNADDSSGIMTYVRIEYAGYVCGTNTELNSLTLCGVGRKTVLSHIQTSFGQDDGYEFFGGTASPDHIISYGNRDDDFDTDNGFSGNVQFGLIIRIDTIADQGDISNAFESDNDANGSYNDPYTKGVFSNVTVIGPAETTTSTIDSKYGWALRIRRSSGLNVFNSLFIGYKRGLRFEGTATQTKAATDTLEFKNNIIAGSTEQYYETAFDSLYLLAQPSNTIFGGNANSNVNLASPYGNPANYDFRPQTGSPALSGASFTNAKLSGFTNTTYRGAFGNTEDWTECWGEFTPNDEDYTSGPIDYSYTASLSPSGATTFCQGNSIDLSVTSGASGLTYNWSTGATTQSINVTTSGTYTVEVRNARGCSKTFTQVVTVNPAPTTPVVTPGATSFCTGSAGVTLSSSAANSYAWSNSETTQQITIATGGTYIVTVTDANGCTAASTQVQITENTPVVPVIAAGGPTSFCTGDSVTISVNSSNNYTAFNWSNSGNTASITVATTGTYSVTTTDNNGCTAISNDIATSVSSTPTPTISAGGATTFCGGDTVTLTSTQGESYLWSNGATTQFIDVTASGTYSVTVVNNANACLGVGGSNQITVTVTPQPVAGFTQATSGNSYTYAFTSSSTNGTTFNWSFGDNQTSTAENPTHTYTQNGTYTVTLTVNNGSCSDVHTATVTVQGVGINEVLTAIDAIRLFPNPNSGSATLAISVNQQSEVNIIASDITGRQAINFNQQLTAGENLLQLNTAEFANGIYFIAIRNGAEVKTVRMVVNK